MSVDIVEGTTKVDGIYGGLGWSQCDWIVFASEKMLLSLVKVELQVEARHIGLISARQDKTRPQLECLKTDNLVLLDLVLF